MTDSLHSPPSKRIKLEDLSAISISEQIQSHEEPPEDNVDTNEDADAADEDGENCSICLQSLVDRTVIPKCSHEFCFECLLLWTEQSRRCPLCTQIIGDYLIHSIRSRYDYRKHYLPPLRTSPPPSRPAQPNPVLQNTRHYARRRRREREWATQRRDSDESDRLERSIEMRRWIYRHDVYAKHVASNSFTKYRPYPTPAQFSASQDLISRTTTFLRRELQVWEGLDVEVGFINPLPFFMLVSFICKFLTTLIISLMKAIDIRSESAVKLISEFLDMDAPYTPGGRHVNAEHFAHEVYCYVRSPYKDLFVYDSVVQYEAPPGVSPPPNEQRHQGPRASSSRDQLAPSRSGQEQISSRPRSRSRSPIHSRIPNRSESWSPSGRKYSPLQDSKHGDVHELFTPRVLDETSIKGPPRPGAGMKDLSIIPITPRMEDHESAAQCLRMIMILPNHLLLEDVLHLVIH
ncbi:hypothetical protein BJ912DRAFT_1079987 [Pholiota molesta]|nr:hypothetical protein BJ912DRAFT_1079987 [Pholiota molesta]